MTKQKIGSVIKRGKLLSQIRSLNKRWNIVFDEKEDIEKFRNRVLVVIDEVVGDYILENQKISRRYAFSMGKDVSPSTFIGDPGFDSFLNPTYFRDNLIYQILSNSMDKLSFIIALQTLFWVLEENDCPKLWALANGIQTAINFSPNVNLQIVNRGKHVTIYAAGAKLLDEQVVNETLTWLETKPDVAKHFEQALRIFLSKDKTKYRNLLDNLRFALEQLVKSILNNKKSLENQDTILLSWLKSNGTHQQIINLYKDLIARFIQYQNDAVKHNENWSLIEIEFMIYLTGTFMHFLLQLDAGSNVSKISAKN